MYIKKLIHGTEGQRVIGPRRDYVERGLQQGCCMSPILLYLYGKWPVKVALEDIRDLKVEDRRIKTIKYADGLVVLFRLIEGCL